MRYRADIDGLRCVAIVLVCLFHFNLLSGMEGGFVGVDIFFVISGYLISSLVWGQLAEGRFRLSNFYLRRFRRLAPALICVQLLLLIFSGLFLMPQELTDLAKQSLATQLYVVNFYFWKKVNYFGGPAENIPLLHCWSLAVEEQFYLLYPPFLMLVHRYARRHLGRVLALLAAVSFLLNVALVHRHQEITFYLLPTRAWELALGALLPFAQPWFANSKAARFMSGLAGAGLVAASALTYHHGIPFPGTFALLPTLGAAALILAGTGAGSPISRFLAAPPFVYLGKISYSLYLVHWPLKVLAPIFFVDFPLPLRWASFILAIVLAALLFRFVEDPIRRGTLLVGGRRFVGAYGIGCAVVLVVLGWAIASDGWTHRFADRVQKMAAFADDRDVSARACEDRTRDAADGPCHLGAPSATPSWVVVGDSHAWALGHAFSLFLERRGEAGVLTFTHGCMPVLGLGDPKCQAFNDDVAKWIAASPAIHDVALVSIWRQPFEDGLMGPHHEFLRGDAELAMFKQQFHETVQHLRAARKNVYVWEPLAPARKMVPVTLARNLAFGWHLEIERSRSEHERQFAFLTETLAANRELLRGVISPASTMCRSGTCAVSDDQGALFFDNNHPAHSRADFYSRIIESGVGAPPSAANSAL